MRALALQQSGILPPSYTLSELLANSRKSRQALRRAFRGHSPRIFP